MGSWRQDPWRQGLAPMTMVPSSLPRQRHDGRGAMPLYLDADDYGAKIGSVFKNLSAMGIFERIFRKNDLKNKGPLAYNPSYSACFFSRNSIFLSQKISQQCFSAGL
jgi:hypothetical protein